MGHLDDVILVLVSALVGGVGYTDNLRIDKALEVSKIQEIIGGSRNIQILLVTQAIKSILKLIE